LVVTSTEFVDSLDAADRDQLMGIIADVSAERNAMAEGINQSNRAKILDEGGVIRELSADQRAAWVSAMAPVWGQFADGIGQDIIDAAAASSN
jgi:C4-dicarboxylate-binding protein DctP